MTEPTLQKPLGLYLDHRHATWLIDTKRELSCALHQVKYTYQSEKDADEDEDAASDAGDKEEGGKEHTQQGQPQVLVQLMADNLGKKGIKTKNPRWHSWSPHAAHLPRNFLKFRSGREYGHADI